MSESFAARWGAAGAGAALFVGTALAGPIMALGAAIAVLVGVAIYLAPMIGLAATVFANTSFQIMGSAHLTGLPTSASRAVAAVTLIAWLAQVMVGRRRPIASAQNLALAALAGMVVLWDIVMPSAAGQMAGATRLVSALILFVLVAQIAGRSFRSLAGFVHVLLAAMATCGVIGMAEHFLPTLHIESDDQRLEEGAVGAVLDRESLEGVVIKRITGGLGDANWLAYSLACAMPLALWAWSRTNDIRVKALVALAALLMAAGLALSYTRTGFFGLAVAVLYLIWRRALPWRHLAIAGILAGGAALVYLPPGFTERFFSESYLKEGSTPLRALFKTRAYQIALESPLIGHGFAGFGARFYESVQRREFPNDDRLLAWAADLERAVADGRERVENIGAHNLYLELLCEYGLIGLAVFTLFAALVFRDLRWVAARGSGDERLLAICIAAGLVGFLACGILGHAKYLKVPWMLAGASVALRATVAARLEAAHLAALLRGR